MANSNWKRLRPGKMKKLGRTVLLILGVSVAAAYIAGIVVMFGAFQANTSVNGVDVSHLSAGEAEEVYRRTYEDWSMTIRTVEGREEIIDGDDIGFALEMEPDFPYMVRHQNYLKWPVTPWLSTNIKSREHAVYDEALLEAAIGRLDCVAGEEIRDPVDAHITRAEEGGYYILVEADDGNRLKEERTRKAVGEAISAGETVLDLEAAGCYEKASVYASDPELQAAFAPIDAFQQTVISISMEGGVVEELTKEIYGSWLTYEEESGEISVGSDPAFEYAVSLYNKYSTFGHARGFRTHEGDIVEVGGSSEDCFGYDMDLEATASSIRDALLTGETQRIDCTWNRVGLQRNELGSDFGDTYIEISLDQQRMWYYMDGEVIVSTNVVSGLATESRATPTGCFKVLDKLRNHTMQGSYGQAFANYVIAIMFNGICIHDSSWRGEYGGDIWLYDGSHGCVNTPYEAVKTIYENTWDGVPVIIYDRANTVPVVHNELYAGTDSEIAGDYEAAHGDEEYE